MSGIGRLIKQHRVTSELTLGQLSERSGVSPSYLGRIERGKRFPSAHILRKIAPPLGRDESELFSAAGCLSPQSQTRPEGKTDIRKLDPYVARVLSEEPVEVQRIVIAILNILKSVAGGLWEVKTSNRRALPGETGVPLGFSLPHGLNNLLPLPLGAQRRFESRYLISP